MPDNGACLNNNGSSGLNLGISRDGSPVNLSVDSGVACDASSCGTNSLSRPRKSHFSTKRFWNKMPTLISPSPSKTSLPGNKFKYCNHLKNFKLFLKFFIKHFFMRKIYSFMFCILFFH